MVGHQLLRGHNLEVALLEVAVVSVLSTPGIKAEVASVIAVASTLAHSWTAVSSALAHSLAAVSHALAFALTAVVGWRSILLLALLVACVGEGGDGGEESKGKGEIHDDEKAGCFDLCRASSFVRPGLILTSFYKGGGLEHTYLETYRSFGIEMKSDVHPARPPVPALGK
jgi:hypothetical protein